MGLSGLTDDILSVFKRRVFDLAAVTDKAVKVKYNNEFIPIKSFLQYVDYYVGDKNTHSPCSRRSK
jgi:DNA topoisomerase-2